MVPVAGWVVLDGIAEECQPQGVTCEQHVAGVCTQDLPNKLVCETPAAMHHVIGTGGIGTRCGDWGGLCAQPGNTCAAAEPTMEECLAAGVGYHVLGTGGVPVACTAQPGCLQGAFLSVCLEGHGGMYADL